MDRERSQIYRICARKERHRYAQPSIPNGGYLRGCAKTEVALRDELSLSLRPRPAEFAAADRPHAKSPGPAVPTALDPVRGRRVWTSMFYSDVFSFNVDCGLSPFARNDSDWRTVSRK